MQLDIPVVGILRGVELGFFRDLLEASFGAGLQALEVTMNTTGAEKIISGNRHLVTEGKLLGMGTICNLDEAKRAVAAGAMFLVTPNFDHTVVEYAISEKISVIAGAMSPTEIYSAWSAGADMVKVFPCRSMGGASYISEIRGPFSSIPLVAVGGVSLENVQKYFTAGATAVGVGRTLFGDKALRERDCKQVAVNVKKFISHCPLSEKTL